MNKNNRFVDTDKEEGYYAWFLFLIWPFLAVVTAFKNYDKRWAKNILWVFTAYYGFTYSIGAESQGADIVRYVSGFQSFYGVEMTLSKAINIFQESGEIDILRTFIAITLSRFTDSQAALTLVYGIIYGYFFSRNMWYVLERLEGKLKPITILLLISFFLTIPIWSITGFRMWTAAHIFFYGLLPYLYEGKKKGVWISSLAILVHFSFVVPVVVLAGYMIMGNRLMLYFGFFITTFFISEINLEMFNQIVENYAPEILQERSSPYRSEGYVEDFREGPDENLRWYAVWHSIVKEWAVMGFLVMIFLNGRSFISENNGWLRLFSFILLFYGVSNIFSSIPSGHRFVAVANFFALAFIILYIQNQRQNLIVERFVWLATPALLLSIIVGVRMALYSLSAASVLGNPVLAAFFMGENISLNDVLKLVL